MQNASSARGKESQIEVQRIVKKRSGVTRWVTVRVTEWQTPTSTKTDEESEAKYTPWKIFRSCSHDKSTRVITHSGCPLWFMEWDRNSLTERRAAPSITRKHWPMSSTAVHRASCWLDTLGLINFSTKGLLSPSLSPLPWPCVKVWVETKRYNGGKKKRNNESYKKKVIEENMWKV